MHVAIAGAHGKIALLLAARLARRGDTVTGLIRNPSHEWDLLAHEVRPVVCDLEEADRDEVALAINRADVVVFAAGAGPGSGAERKLTMDRDGATKLLDAARQADVPAYVMVSAMGADDPPEGDEVFAVYLRAKAEADAAVQASDRSWTIIRPGRLTDDPSTGCVRIESSPFQGEVPRGDVAELLDAVLHEPRAAGQILYVNAGDTTVEDSLAAVLS